MIGKIKSSNYTYLFFFISFALVVNTLIFQNLLLISIYLIGFLISLSFTKYGLKIIYKLNLLQNIRDESPSSHQKKKNTPTMGGIFIICPFVLVLLLINNIFDSSPLKLLLFCVVCFFFIGFIDDYLSISKNENKGLKSYEKFLFQTFIAIFCIVLSFNKGYIDSSIIVSNNFSIDANLMIFPISFITLVGLSNAVNLTDGLDGLASGCSALVFYGLGTEILLKNEQELIVYSLLCFVMSGLCMGFLKFNKYPAKIFMGDTGSLTIGATLGFISILSNSYLTLVIISGIFISEALSVVLQVSFFKFTKKFFKKGRRIFLMTPIHHHFEIMGVKEEKIVDNFWKINICLVILGIVIKITL